MYILWMDRHQNLERSTYQVHCQHRQKIDRTAGHSLQFLLQWLRGDRHTFASASQMQRTQLAQISVELWGSALVTKPHHTASHQKPWTEGSFMRCVVKSHTKGCNLAPSSQDSRIDMFKRTTQQHNALPRRMANF